MSEFKAGDRVRRCGHIEGVLVGADQRPSMSHRWIVWTPKEGEDFHFGEWSSWAASDLTLIPDTVSVTVELPRDEAEDVAGAWGADPDEYPALMNRGAARLAEALRSVL